MAPESKTSATVESDYRDADSPEMQGSALRQSRASMTPEKVKEQDITVPCSFINAYGAP